MSRSSLPAAGAGVALVAWVADVARRSLQMLLDALRRTAPGRGPDRVCLDDGPCSTGSLEQAQDALRDAQEAAMAESQAARDRSRRFLDDAAHQLRTPIAGIQACAETLLRQPFPTREVQERMLSQIVQGTSHVGRLVGDLLEAARADQGMHLGRTPCDLLAICRDVVDRVQRLEPALVVSAMPPAWPGPLPLLDPTAVHDIVAILMDNARRHASSRITVTVANRGGATEVRVADDGPGLCGETADRAFEWFASLDGGGGSGLGLPIARELARAHDGDIGYHDGEFVVSLPHVADRTDGPPPDAAPA